MASKDFDFDFDDECCGYVGGEKGKSGTAADDGCEYDFGSCKEIADRLTGSEHAYLGHFRQKGYARAGHNDVTLNEPGLPPLNVPSGAVSPQAVTQLQQMQPKRPQVNLRSLGLNSDEGTGGLD